MLCYKAMMMRGDILTLLRHQMGVSYREFLRSQGKTAQNEGVPRASKGQATITGAEIWAKYARVARYRHHKRVATPKASQVRML